MSFYLFFLFAIAFCDSDTTNKTSSNIITIESNDMYDSILENKTISTIVIYIYSPHCPHCIEFSPKMEKIADMYVNDDSIKFIKISSEHEEIFDSRFTIEGYPQVILANQEQFLYYMGLNEIDDVYEFINDKIDFKCKEIETMEHFDNFIEENVIYSKEKEKQFVLAVFDKGNGDKDEIVQYYNEMNIKNKDIMKSNMCYYFLYNDNEINLKSGLNNKYILQFMLNSNKHFIFSYNYQKGINTYSLFDSELMKKEETKKEIDVSYRNFLLDNLFPFYETFSNDKLNELFDRKRKFVIFSYENEKEQRHFESLVSSYIISKEYNKNLIILFVDIEKENEKKKNGVTTYLQYFYFGGQSGMFIASEKFNDVKKLQAVDREGISLNEKYKYSDLLALLKDDLMKEEKKKINLSKYKTATIKQSSNENDTSLETNQTETEKLVDKEAKKQTSHNLKGNKDEEKIIDINEMKIVDDDVIDTKILILPLYLCIYTVIFYYLYKYYLYKFFNDDSSHNPKSI